MPDLSRHLHPDDLKKIGNLQLLARQVVDGFQSGLHRSPHKGSSVEFKQHRQYVQGDELRRLDWKAFGKSDRFYIREFEEETNLRCTLILDKSGSMSYQGSASPLTKFQYAAHLAAALGYLMLKQQDAVGLVTFDDKVRDHIPPRSRPAHLSAIARALETVRPGEETEIADVFKALAPKIHRGGLLVILSDCFGDVAALMKALAQFRHQRHEIILFQIWDRDELEFPFYHRTRFESLEDPADAQMVDPVHLRATYLESLARFREDLRQGCFRNRIDLVPVVTDAPYADALAGYLALRRGRSR